MKKAKRTIALLLALVLAFALAACGGDSGGGDGEKVDKLTVWALADDMKQFGEKYKEETGIDVEVVVIAPEDYPTKLQTAIRGNNKDVDIIMGEPQMLPDFYALGAFADLDALGAKDYEGQITDYVWKFGQDENGVQRSVSYQVTPPASTTAGTSPRPSSAPVTPTRSASSSRTTPPSWRPPRP